MVMCLLSKFSGEGGGGGKGWLDDCPLLLCKQY